MAFEQSYVYKKEIDWSVLTAGWTLPIDNQVVFGQIMGRFLQRGEKKEAIFFLEGESFRATITNVNFSEKYRDAHKTDILQIRYNDSSPLAAKLRSVFSASYAYFLAARESRTPGSRKRIYLPESSKEYLAIYTTEYDDTYILEPLTVDDIAAVKEEYTDKDELQAESDLLLPDITDPNASIAQKTRTVKIRKLNRLIGENLKQLYGYRCQLCGQPIGEEFGARIADAHHIDYFVKSMNNDMSNQMILCPNHHRIIHETNPVFQRSAKEYVFPNGKHAPLVLNKHL